MENNKIIHTIIQKIMPVISDCFKTLPYSFYIVSFFFSFLFHDMRGILFLTGGSFNSLLNYFFNRLFISSDSLVSTESCKGIFDIFDNFSFADNYTQAFAYIIAFYILTQNQTSNLKILGIITIIIMLILVLFYRKVCLNNYIKVLIGFLIGSLFAIIYYHLIMDYYNESNGFLTEEESLECEEID